MTDSGHLGPHEPAAGDMEPHELAPERPDMRSRKTQPLDEVSAPENSADTIKAAVPSAEEKSDEIELGSGVVTGDAIRADTESIYQIRNQRARATRIVKVLRADATHLMRLAFENESLLLSQLRHSNIILFKGAGYHQSLPFSEIESVNGPTLRQFIDQHGALPPVMAMAVGVQILAAMAYFHTKTVEVRGGHYGGILHRNLHPESILIGSSGVVKVTGFGIATPVDAEYHTYVAEHTPGLPYFAPELLKGGKADRSSDLFSFGLLMYEMLCGKPAFAAQSRALLMHARLNNRYVPLAKCGNRTPADLVRLVEGCLTTDAAQRRGDAEELFGELSAMLETRVPEAPAELIMHFVRAGNEGLKKGRLVSGGRVFPTVPVFWAAGAIAVILVAGMFMLAGKAKSPKPVPPPVVSAAQATDPKSKPKLAVPAVATRSRQTAATRTVKGSARSRVSSKVSRHASLVSALKTAARNQKWDTVMKLYAALPDADQNRDSFLILKLRGLAAIGDLKALGEFFSAHTINDGEYYLLLARYYHGMHNLTATLNALDRAETTPVKLSKGSRIFLEILYDKARVFTDLYYQYPSGSKKRKAIKTWKSVKSAYEDNPSHVRYIEAGQKIASLEEAN